jgi:exopolysaccharide biosynthesis polyprenyl glycosylphosphotransferase
MLKNFNKRKIILLIVDILLIYLSLFITVFLGFEPGTRVDALISHTSPFSILFLFWLIGLYISGFYDLHQPKTTFNLYSKIAASFILNFIFGIVFFYLIPSFGITPKTNLLINMISFSLLFYIWRKIFYTFFSSKITNNVAIVGKQEIKKDLEKEISNRPYLGYKVIEIDEGSLLKELSIKNIDILVIAEDEERDIYSLISDQVTIFDLPQAYETFSEKIPTYFVTQNWFLINLKKSNKFFYETIKRLIDIISSVFFSILFLPLIPFIALAIKLESEGPVFYSQERVGKDKETFKLVKFRSMTASAEKESGAVWAQEKDPRITKVGKVLRRTHLDEIPQLINILKGDIALVGPRPERPEFVEKLEEEIPNYNLRHLIKPGFTGWAQVRFRYARTIDDSEEKFEYDLYYLKNRNIVVDAIIFLKTFALFFKK